MFQIKICGVRRVQDANAIAESGADAIGLNFYPHSPRSVAPARAAEMVQAARASTRGNPLAIVGVFVNATPAQIEQAIDEVGLDWVQLHGDETVDSYTSISVPVIRAIRFENVETTNREIETWRGWGAQAILLDARNEKEYGGTGKTIDWSTAARVDRSLPIVLAGGLNGDNIGRAIRTFRPAAIDTASGVESSPGVKDHAQVVALVRQARRAFDAL